MSSSSRCGQAGSSAGLVFFCSPAFGFASSDSSDDKDGSIDGSMTVWLPPMGGVSGHPWEPSGTPMGGVTPVGGVTSMGAVLAVFACSISGNSASFFTFKRNWRVVPGAPPLAFPTTVKKPASTKPWMMRRACFSDTRIFSATARMDGYRLPPCSSHQSARASIASSSLPDAGKRSHTMVMILMLIWPPQTGSQGQCHSKPSRQQQAMPSRHPGSAYRERCPA